VKTPSVSIIIPCYNGARTLRQTLESVRRQTLADWECILVDDGSTDESGIIFESYRKMDVRFRSIRQGNQGLASARNRGLQNATGIYIQFLDADDLLLENKLESAVETLQSNPKADAVYCDYALLSGNEFFQTLPARIPDADPVRSFLFRWNIDFIIPVHAFLFRTTVAQHYEFAGVLKSHAEDVECWIRMATNGVRFLYQDLVGVVYRISAQSATSDEERLIGSRIHVLKSFVDEPSLQRFTPEFDTALHGLNRRLVIAKFMKKDFQEGLKLFKEEWRFAGLWGNVRMLGWLVLMLISSKERVERLRHRIISRTSVRWGGWRHYRPWEPPGSIQQLLAG
jgi:glycosyltransferase involved in cell wall biosynthesis